jgi:hypothetical protein
MMSGLTSKYSAPNPVPRRPTPVMTSSRISKRLCLVKISQSLFRCQTGGIIAPAEPATGSTITAAILSAECNVIKLSNDSARSAPPDGGIPLVKAFWLIFNV